MSLDKRKKKLEGDGRMFGFKKKLFKVIFPFYYQEYEDYKASWKKKCDKVNIIEQKLNNQSKFKDTVLEVLSDGGMIIGFEKINGLEVLIYKELNNADITLIDATNSKNVLTKILADYKPLNNTCSKKIYICDIYTYRNENNGYGSLAMKHLINIAKKENVSKIEGDISFVDEEHIDRLEHFYKKNGFQVIINNKRTSGSLIMEL